MTKKLTRRQFGKLVIAGSAAVGGGRLLTLGSAHAQGPSSAQPVEGLDAAAPHSAALAPTQQLDYNYRPLTSGVVLTHATMAEIKDCIALGGYNMLKIITSWGLATGHNWTTDGIGWTQPSIDEVLQIPQLRARGLIVRSAHGDGTHWEPSLPDAQKWTYALPDPATIISQVQPWYDRGQTLGKGILIELGNEPNGRWGWVEWALKAKGWPAGSDGIPNQLKAGSYNSEADEFIQLWRERLDATFYACRQQ